MTTAIFDAFAAHPWSATMAFLSAAACGLVGNYLLLRRMALMGDAISHSVLPGLVVAFLFTGSRGTGAMFLGALSAGLAATVIIEVIHRKTRVKQDAAIGIAFSTLFALGVVLMSVFARQVDLDADCVLYGELLYLDTEPLVSVGGRELAPAAVLRMGLVLLVIAALVIVFYKELLVSSFDAGLAATLGVNPTRVHFALMAAVSVVVVSAFDSVGAILVIAMLILPGATALLLTQRLPAMHGLALLHAVLSTLLGVPLSVAWDCSMAGALVVAGAAWFGLAWIFAPQAGLLARVLRKPALETSPELSVANRRSD